MIAQRSFLNETTEEEWHKVSQIFANEKRAYDFINGYSRTDSQIVRFRNDSLTVWDISQPSFLALQVHPSSPSPSHHPSPSLNRTT